MERLTERWGEGDVWVKEHDYISAAHRLADYEDTGLTPESVEALKLSMMGKAISEITGFEGLPIDRLKELALADKEGRVVVRCPDCKHHHDCGIHYCTRLGMDCPDDSKFFCSYGKLQTNTKEGNR